MKTYWRSGRIAPRINLGTGWRWVVSFTPRPLYLRYHWTGDWVGPRTVLDAVAWTKLSQPRRGLEPRSSSQ